MARTIELFVNGIRHTVEVEPERVLLTVLRDDLDLTGTKYGCGEGQCGACTVLIDGVAARSCQIRAGALAGRQVTTIEGLERDGHLHPLQDSFLEIGAMQCAYCTSGMILSGLSLLKKNPKPSAAEIVAGMQGNVCRCGAYSRIIAAVQLAASRMGKQA